MRRERDMKRTKAMYVGAMAVAIAVLLAPAPVGLNAQQETVVRIDNDDIGGVVTSANGPEAGVWVIAETTDLPTKLAKIVVTDDQGRYMIPDLPKANYSVWVRGYGLVDSPKVKATPGKGVAATMKSQGQWLDTVKTDGCYTCHQLGNKATRTIPKELGHFDSSKEAWSRRIVSGQAMTNMANNIGQMGPERAFALFADWTDRIAAGELPASQPSRPQGVERNVVITLWDWATPKAYLHDEIATDKRNPTVNANGLIYGSPEDSTDFVPILDPVHHRATQVKMPVRDPKTPVPGKPLKPSPYWGDEAIWDSQANMHNPMFDEKGRVWFTSVIRPPENPAFCKQGSSHPSAKAFPVN